MIKIFIKGSIAQLTLNRPQVHNAFNDEMIKLLTQSFQDLEKNPHLRAIVLGAEGKSFCAGADLHWMKQMGQYCEEENIQDAQRLRKLFEVINECSLPVIGKVQGAALGGGAGLVCCCDWVVSNSIASIGFTEVKLGLVPAVISPFVIDKIGVSHARSLFLSGQILNADQAQRVGLFHEVTENLDEAVEKQLQRYLRASPSAIKEAKILIREVHKNRTDISDYTSKMIARLRMSPEGQEGMKALIQKRCAQWVNHDI